MSFFTSWKTLIKEHHDVLAAEMTANEARGERMIIEPELGQVIHGAVVSKATVALTNERLIMWGSGSEDRRDVPLSTVIDVDARTHLHSGTQGGSLFVVLRLHKGDDAVLQFKDDVAPRWKAAIQKLLDEHPS